MTCSDAATTRCTGHCCRAFTIPYSPEEIQECQHVGNDGEVIADMLVYLGHMTAEAAMLGAGVQCKADPEPGLAHYYTCRHLVSGDCTIYEQRPSMCRGYPYGEACQYPECTAAKRRLPIMNSCA